MRIWFHLKVGSFVAALMLMSGCASAPSGPRIDNVPMYGQPQLVRPDSLKRADAVFIATASSAFGGDRKAASKAWCAQADRFLGERNLDFAMRRFNQAWLLDDRNYEVYWGFGRVLLEADRCEEGVRFMTQALELCDDPHQLPALHSDLGSAWAYRGHQVRRDADARQAAFAEANSHFNQAVSLAPEYANAWRRWTMALIFAEEWIAAEEKLARAKALGAEALPSRMAAALAARQAIE